MDAEKGIVLEAREDAGLAEKATSRGLVIREGHDLHGDLTPKRDVLREVDHAHPAPSDRTRDHEVRAEPRTGREFGRGVTRCVLKGFALRIHKTIVPREGCSPSRKCLTT